MAAFVGTNQSDTVTGTEFDDVIVSGAGSDIITAAAGDDLILAGNGDDTVDAGSGDDLVLAGNGDDTVDGGSGDDAILAGNGDDDIIGGLGSDLIDGGRGFDTAMFADIAQNYSFQFYSGSVVVTDLTNGDQDLLTRIELLRFDNATFVLDGTNNAPIADDLTADVHEDGPEIAGNLLVDANAFDFEGDTLSIVAVNGDAAAVGNEIVLASGALLTVNSDGSYSYDPNGQFEELNTGETATDTVTFEISDGSDTITRTIDFIIEGEDDNVAPVANDFAYTVSASDLDGPFYFHADDADADDDPSTLAYHSTGMLEPPFAIAIPNPTAVFVNPVSGGEFFVIHGANLTALTQDEVKEYTFTYTATDSHGAVSNEATITFSVIGENDAPARPQGFSLAVSREADTGIVDVPYNVVDPDSDDDSSSLTYDIQTTTGYTVVDNGNGTYSVDTDDPAFDHLAEGQWQTVTFTFDATDSHGATTQFTNSNLVIIGTNDDPVAAADSFQTQENQPVTGNLFADNGVGEDSDVDDGDTFRIIEVDGVSVDDDPIEVVLDSGALLTINEDGTFTYDPNGAFDDLEADEMATDTFEYAIEDDYDGTDTAIVTIEITGVGEPLLL